MILNFPNTSIRPLSSIEDEEDYDLKYGPERSSWIQSGVIEPFINQHGYENYTLFIHFNSSSIYWASTLLYVLF